MSTYQYVLNGLCRSPKIWLVTGAAGFIGSNLIEQLLKCKQTVIGLDNFVTGHQANLEDVKQCVEDAEWKRFRFIQGDITHLDVCTEAVSGVDYVLHQAALGSVPRSISDPISSHHANVDGFLNILTAARQARVKRLVYASSSSVYGDHPDLPKVEERIGRPLSPYALTKSICEQYAAVFAEVYGFSSIGLRYFNVFGRRQDPKSAYAAVIPKWVNALACGERCIIHGDGETSRDFCHIANVVQANILAATVDSDAALDQVYNVAYGASTTLNQLFQLILEHVQNQTYHALTPQEYTPVHDAFRPGDVRHSLAEISKAQRLLGYAPTHSLVDGLRETIGWYLARPEIRQ